MKALVLVLAAILTSPFANAAERTAKHIELSECSSRTLIIRLNHKNQSTKKDIVRGMRVVGDYLDLISTPIHGPTHEVVIEVQPICQRSNDDDCAYESGWNEVQDRLLSISGAKAQCKPSEEQSSDPSPPPPPPPPPPAPGEAGGGTSAPDQASQQEESAKKKDSLQRPRRRSEGGVTGSN